MVMFVGLGLIVGSPFLSVGDLDRLGVALCPVCLHLPLNHVFYGVDMLTRQLASLKIGASAERLTIHTDNVGAVP